MSDYKPDKSKTHQEFVIQAERPLDDICTDLAEIKVHSKAEAERIVETFRDAGFAVKLTRHSKAVLEDDPFEGDDDEDKP